MLLGDDIVIADDKVALEYTWILQQLDVPVSPTKTHVSKDTYEFAKRWWHRGAEVTPFPVHGLLEVGSKYYLLPGFFRELACKGFDVTAVLCSVPVVVHELFRTFGIYGRLLDNLYLKYRLVLSIPLAGSDFEQIYDNAKRFVSLAGIRLSCVFRPSSVVKIFEQQARAVATFMLARNSEKILRTQLKWENQLSQYIESLQVGPDDQSELLSSVVSSVPALVALAERLEASSSCIGFDNRTGNQPGSIWDFSSHFELVPIPGVQGLLPERKSHRVARTIAAWALTLRHSWLNYEVGKRPGRL